MKQNSNRSALVVTVGGWGSFIWLVLKVVSDIIGFTTIPDDASSLWLKLEPLMSAVDSVPWLVIGPIVIVFYIYLALRALNFDWPTVLTAIRTRTAISNKEYTARYVGDATAKMDRLEAKFDEKFDSLVETNNRGIDALFENKKMSIALTFAAIAEIFEARKALHLHSHLLQEIDELMVYLDTKEVPSDFIHEHQEWERKVKDWHEGLESYILTPSPSPLIFDPKQLRSTSWQDWIKDIDDSNLQISLKTFSIQKDSFTKVRTRYIGILTDKAHSSLVNGGGGRADIVRRFTD